MNDGGGSRQDWKGGIGGNHILFPYMLKPLVIMQEAGPFVGVCIWVNLGWQKYLKKYLIVFFWVWGDSYLKQQSPKNLQSIWDFWAARYLKLSHFKCFPVELTKVFEGIVVPLNVFRVHSHHGIVAWRRHLEGPQFLFPSPLKQMEDRNTIGGPSN